MAGRVSLAEMLLQRAVRRLSPGNLFNMRVQLTLLLPLDPYVLQGLRVIDIKHTPAGLY